MTRQITNNVRSSPRRSGDYCSVTIGLYAKDYEQMEAAAIKANKNNSEFLRELVHKALGNGTTG